METHFSDLFPHISSFLRPLACDQVLVPGVERCSWSREKVLWQSFTQRSKSATFAKVFVFLFFLTIIVQKQQWHTAVYFGWLNAWLNLLVFTLCVRLKGLISCHTVSCCFLHTPTTFSVYRAKEKISSQQQFSGWNCLVGGQRIMVRLLQGDRKVIITLIATSYDQGIKKSY